MHERQPLEMRRRLNLFAFGNPMLDISARMSLADVAKLGLQPDEDGSDLDDDAKRAVVASLLAGDGAMQEVRSAAGGSALNTMRAAKAVLGDAVSCTCVGAIGDPGSSSSGGDAAATMIEAACAEAGVEGCFLKVHGEPTGTCAVLLAGSTRTLVGVRGAHKHYNAKALLQPVVAARVASAHLLYCTSFVLTNECRTEAAALLAKEASTGELRRKRAAAADGGDAMDAGESDDGNNARPPLFAVGLSSPALMAREDVVDRLCSRLLPSASLVFANKAELLALAGSIAERQPGKGGDRVDHKGGDIEVSGGDDGDDEVEEIGAAVRRVLPLLGGRGHCPEKERSGGSGGYGSGNRCVVVTNGGRPVVVGQTALLPTTAISTTAAAAVAGAAAAPRASAASAAFTTTIRSFPVEPIAPDDIVSTNGAGDCFAGAFLAQWGQADLFAWEGGEPQKDDARGRIDYLHAAVQAGLACSRACVTSPNGGLGLDRSVRAAD